MFLEVYHIWVLFILLLNYIFGQFIFFSLFIMEIFNLFWFYFMNLISFFKIWTLVAFKLESQILIILMSI